MAFGRGEKETWPTGSARRGPDPGSPAPLSDADATIQPHPTPRRPWHLAHDLVSKLSSAIMSQAIKPRRSLAVLFNSY
jgi:hypothetical protein